MLQRLSEMSDDKKKDRLKRYEEILLFNGIKILQPYDYFDEFGLRFPVDYLNAIGKIIIFLPLEVMAEYVDAFTKGYIDANNEMYISGKVIKEFDIDKDYHSINATGIGNLAYIALNCLNSEAREIAEKKLNEIFDRLKQNLIHEIN